MTIAILLKVKDFLKFGQAGSLLRRQRIDLIAARPRDRKQQRSGFLFRRNEVAFENSFDLFFEPEIILG